MTILKNKWIWAVFVVICAFFMFSGSNTPYQAQDIKPTLKKIITLDEHSLPSMYFTYSGAPVDSRDPYAFIEFFIRKASHVAEYFLLTSFIIGLLHLFGVRFRRIIALVVAFLFACSDEYHQTFVSGRTGHFIDVATFDLAGMLLSLLIYTLVVSIIQWKKSKANKKI